MYSSSMPVIMNGIIATINPLKHFQIGCNMIFNKLHSNKIHAYNYLHNALSVTIPLENKGAFDQNQDCTKLTNLAFNKRANPSAPCRIT